MEVGGDFKREEMKGCGITCPFWFGIFCFSFLLSVCHSPSSIPMSDYSRHLSVSFSYNVSDIL